MTGAGMMDAQARARRRPAATSTRRRSSCASRAWRMPASARAARPPKARCWLPDLRGRQPATIVAHRLRDRAGLEERRVPGVREEGPRRRRRRRGRRRGQARGRAQGADREARREHPDRLAAPASSASTPATLEGYVAPAGEQARRPRPAPRRLARARPQGRDAHRGVGAAVPRARTFPRSSSTAERDIYGTPTRSSRSRSRCVRRSSRGCSTSASSPHRCSGRAAVDPRHGEDGRPGARGRGRSRSLEFERISLSG